MHVFFLGGSSQQTPVVLCGLFIFINVTLRFIIVISMHVIFLFALQVYITCTTLVLQCYSKHSIDSLQVWNDERGFPGGLGHNVEQVQSRNRPPRADKTTVRDGKHQHHVASS